MATPTFAIPKILVLQPYLLVGGGVRRADFISKDENDEWKRHNGFGFV